MLDMRSQVPFGIMRELHRWSAHAMVNHGDGAHVPRVYDGQLQPAARV